MRRGAPDGATAASVVSRSGDRFWAPGTIFSPLSDLKSTGFVQVVAFRTARYCFSAFLKQTSSVHRDVARLNKKTQSDNRGVRPVFVPRTGRYWTYVEVARSTSTVMFNQDIDVDALQGAVLELRQKATGWSCIGGHPARSLRQVERPRARCRKGAPRRCAARSQALVSRTSASASCRSISPAPAAPMPRTTTASRARAAPIGWAGSVMPCQSVARVRDTDNTRQSRRSAPT